MPAPNELSITARIVEWNKRKGFGFLLVGKDKVFLHWRDFAERHKTPAVGDVIRFTPGRDGKGRTCATNAVHVNDGGRITLWAVLLLAGLLLLPVMALYRRNLDFRWIAAYGLVVNVFTCWLYARDKRQARQKEWRISEKALHLVELLGGWPGAYLAQRRLRHKCSKGSYQFVFWLIVLAYQFAAYDSFQDWKFSQAGLNWIEHRSTYR